MLLVEIKSYSILTVIPKSPTLTAKTIYLKYIWLGNLNLKFPFALVALFLISAKSSISLLLYYSESMVQFLKLVHSGA